MRFINPKTDFAFKKIFGSSQSKAILISFLNALIYEGKPTIQDLEIIDPYLAPQFQGLKDTYLDVKAKLNDGTVVIIEMQVLNVESFEKRILYNAAKAYSLQLTKGRNYRKLQPVIALTITDFILFANSDQIISHFVFKERESNLRYLENGIELIFVELPKFLKELEELESLTDQWLYFMRSARMLDMMPESMGQIPEIRQAFAIANQANLNEKELEELEKQEIWIQDRQGELNWARNEGREEGIVEGRAEGIVEGREEGIVEGREEGIVEGRAEGIVEGRAEGIVEGRAEGIVEGRAEGIVEGRAEGIVEGRAEGERAAAIAIARQLLDHLDEAAIAQTTGLSIEDIQALKQGH